MTGRTMNMRLLLLVPMLIFAGKPAAEPADPLPPQARQAVDRACRYLKTTGFEYARNASAGSYRLGLVSLTVLALYKAEAVQPTDPLVREALGLIREDVQNPRLATEYSAPYAIAIALTALSEIDPGGSAAEIRQLRSMFLEFQMSHGGFSCHYQPQHPKRVGGDTSMTQYGALAFWAIDQSGTGVTPGAWQKLASWLLRTQHSSGGYVYEPAHQNTPRLGTTAAALSALYICQARSRLGGRPKPEEDGLPPALEKVQPEGEARPMRSVSLPTARLAQAAQRAEGWLKEHFSFKEAEREYVYYFLYSLERYHSFRELVDPESAASQQWYNQGLDYLLKRQLHNGSWGSDERTAVSPEPAPTAFAVLFLVRATRKMLQDVQPASGKLIGGRGLPPVGSPLELRDGQVRVKPLKGPADQLLGIVGDPNHPRFLQALAALEELGRDPDPQMLSKLERQLRQLAESDSPEAKIAAVKALAATGKMDVVPLLIRLLEDPDLRVMRAARDALRRLSRRMEGFGLPDQPSPKQRRDAVRRWTAWYQTVRPDAVRELLPRREP